MPVPVGMVEDGVGEVGMRGILVRGMKSIDISTSINEMWFVPTLWYFRRVL